MDLMFEYVLKNSMALIVVAGQESVRLTDSGTDDELVQGPDGSRALAYRCVRHSIPMRDKANQDGSRVAGAAAGPWPWERERSQGKCWRYNDKILYLEKILRV